MQHRGVLPTKEFRLLLKVQEWDVARAKGWRSLLGMVRLRVCTRLSQPQVLPSLPLLHSLLLSLHHPGMEGLTGASLPARCLCTAGAPQSGCLGVSLNRVLPV